MSLDIFMFANEKQNEDWELSTKGQLRYNDSCQDLNEKWWTNCYNDMLTSKQWPEQNMLIFLIHIRRSYVALSCHIKPRSKKTQQCVIYWARSKPSLRLWINLCAVLIADTKLCASRKKLSKLLSTTTVIIRKVIYEDSTATDTCENQKALLPCLWGIWMYCSHSYF